MGRLRFPTPFAPLHAANAFRVDQVRPRSRHHRRFLVAMEIYQHVALGGLAAHLIEVVDHDLIAALHEVHFNSLDPPLIELIQRGNQLVVECLPRGP